MRTEAAYSHGSASKNAVLLVNLGTPDAADTPALRRYLKQFLSDPRVVEIPKFIWWIILNLIILRIRPKKSAAKYQTVWTDEGSPLLAISKKQTAGLQAALNAAGLDCTVDLAMRYGNPAVPARLDALRASGHDRILVLPLYPQYAAATTASAMDAVFDWAKLVRNVPEFRFIKHYHDHPVYIAALADSVRKHWAVAGRPNFEGGDLLVFSFHGVPEFALLKGDPYHCECYKTARLLVQALGLEQGQFKVTFQSRFGRAKWLQPYTDVTLKTLAQSGVKRVDLMCPGFLADCLETLEEINQEAREDFLHAGGQHFEYIPCLNDSEALVALLRSLAIQHMQGWPVEKAALATVNEDIASQRPVALGMGAKN